MTEKEFKQLYLYLVHTQKLDKEIAEKILEKIIKYYKGNNYGK